MAKVSIHSRETIARRNGGSVNLEFLGFAFIIFGLATIAGSLFLGLI